MNTEIYQGGPTLDTPPEEAGAPEVPVNLHKDIQRARSDRLPEVMSWDLCFRQLAGEQNYAFDRVRSKIMPVAATPGKNSSVTNQLLQVDRTWRGLMSTATPKFTAVPMTASMDDVTKALATELAAKYLFVTNRVKRILDGNNRWLVGGGNTALHIYFDPEKQTVGIEGISPYDLLFEYGAQTYDETAWIALRHIHRREDLLKAYPDFKESITDCPSLTNDDMRAKMPSDRVETWEVYYKDGRHFILLGTTQDVFLYKGFTPQNIMPVIPYRCHTIANRIYGQPLLWPLLDLQWQYNRFKNFALDVADAISNPVWVVPFNAGVSPSHLTNEPGNFRLPEKPPGYNRDEYVNYNRKGMGAGSLNGKSSFNSAILPGENHAYPEATWPEREQIIARHTNFALGLMYFLQNDESVPPAKREGFRRIGLPLDEFPDNHNLPYEMYVREARRIVGRYIFTEHDNIAAAGLARPPIHADSIAFTDWSMDSHDCTTDRRPGYDYDGKLILTEESRPAQVPYRCLLPKDIDNLLVPVCLSATHVAWGSVRLEPVWMQIGEAAGFAAALSKKHQTTPGKLDPDLLVRTLVTNKHFVTYFNEGMEDVAAQYFGTKGYFGSYDAKLDEPLTEAVKLVWEQKLDGPHHRMQAVAKAEKAASKPAGMIRGQYLLELWKAAGTL